MAAGLRRALFVNLSMSVHFYGLPIVQGFSIRSLDISVAGYQKGRLSRLHLLQLSVASFRFGVTPQKQAVV